MSAGASAHGSVRDFQISEAAHLEHLFEQQWPLGIQKPPTCSCVPCGCFICDIVVSGVKIEPDHIHSNQLGFLFQFSLL